MTRRCLVLLLALAAQPLIAAAADAPGTTHPKFWPQFKPAVARDSKLEERVDALLQKMTVEEKVGQVIQAGITKVTPADVEKYHLGSVLNGGGG